MNMLVHYKQLARQFNILKTKKRYKEKRERRAYLTEAYLDGELALYKPAYAPYKVFTDKIKWVKPEQLKIEEAIKETQEMIKFTGWWDKLKFKIKAKWLLKDNTELTWFDKLIMWIRKVIK